LQLVNASLPLPLPLAVVAPFFCAQRLPDQRIDKRLERVICGRSAATARGLARLPGNGPVHGLESLLTGARRGFFFAFFRAFWQADKRNSICCHISSQAPLIGHL